MKATWQHRKADIHSLLGAIQSLRESAEIPLHPEHQLVIERKVGRVVRDWREGTLLLPEIRAVEIDGRLCGVLGGLGRAQSRWLAKRLWRLHQALVRPIPGAVTLVPQGTPGAIGNLRRDIRDVAAKRGHATVVVFDLRDFFGSQDPMRALDELDRLTGNPSHDSIALRLLYAHAHAADARLRGIVQGLATSPALAELLVRDLDRALADVGLVRRWADDVAVVCAGRREPTELLGQIRAICREVSAERHLALKPHGFQAAVYGSGGFEETLEFLKLRFLGLSVHVSPSRLAEVQENLADLLERDPDHAITYVRAVRRHYAPLLTPDGHNDLDLILDQDQAPGPTSPPLHSPSGAAVHVPSAAEPTSSDGSPPSGALDTRDPTAGREGDPTAGRSSRSARKGAERRYVEIVRDLDQLDAERLGYVVETRGATYRPMHFWLANGDGPATDSEAAWATPDPGQHGVVEQALTRSAQITHSSRRGENLTMICLDFLATNDWHGSADPSMRRRWLHRIAAGLGLRLFAVDARTNAPVLIDPSREALLAIVSAAVGEPDAVRDDEPDDDG